MFTSAQLTRGSVARFVLVSLSVAVLAVAQVAAGKSNKKGAGAADEAKTAKSLSETVKDAERIEGLLTFYRGPDKLYMHRFTRSATSHSLVVTPAAIAGLTRRIR